MRDLILANVLLARTLDEAELGRLVEAAQALADSKNWEGCGGMRITDEVKATIAGQAAMLLLGLPGYRFDELRTILVYPGRFIADWEDELGLEQEQEELEAMLGQAVEDGPVILSWWDVRWEARRQLHGNTVLHEFAHKLAELGDAESGMPPIADPAIEKKWKKTMRDGWKQLRRDADAGRPTLLDTYGAESPSEFFAVATESFFLRPLALRERHPDIYALLAGCYKQDPAARPVVAEEHGEEAEREYNHYVQAECTAALKRDPGLLEAHAERAECRTWLGDYEGALADWDAVGDEHADDVLGRAWTLQKAGRLEEAMEACQRAEELDEDDPAPLIEKAAVLEAMGRDDEALAALGEALGMVDDAETLAARAKLHRKAGRPEQALADLRRAAMLDPYLGPVFEARAEVLEGLGRHAEAKADREKARRLLS